MSERRAGLLVVTTEALKGTLGLAEGVRLRDVRWNGFRLVYELLVEDHPALPLVYEGDEPAPVSIDGIRA